jgi:hypothetical protein
MFFAGEPLNSQDFVLQSVQRRREKLVAELLAVPADEDPTTLLISVGHRPATRMMPNTSDASCCSILAMCFSISFFEMAFTCTSASLIVGSPALTMKTSRAFYSVALMTSAQQKDQKQNRNRDPKKPKQNVSSGT